MRPFPGTSTTGAVRLAGGSLGLTAVVLPALIVRGPRDWSRSFGVAWYALLVSAVVLGIAAIVIAVARRGLQPQTRVLAIVLSLPAILTAAVTVFLVTVVTSLDLTS